MLLMIINKIREKIVYEKYYFLIKCGILKIKILNICNVYNFIIYNFIYF